MFGGLSSSIRVGLPSAGDPHGDTGPGMWWLTGGCRPAYMWDRSDRPPRSRRPLRDFWRQNVSARRSRASGRAWRQKTP